MNTRSSGKEAAPASSRADIEGAPAEAGRVSGVAVAVAVRCRIVNVPTPPSTSSGRACSRHRWQAYVPARRWTSEVVRCGLSWRASCAGEEFDGGWCVVSRQAARSTPPASVGAPSTGAVNATSRNVGGGGGRSGGATVIPVVERRRAFTPVSGSTPRGRRKRQRPW